LYGRREKEGNEEGRERSREAVGKEVQGGRRRWNEVEGGGRKWRGAN
jgi:hypothetical protein